MWRASRPPGICAGGHGAWLHPLYAILSASTDDAGKNGNVAWNFEKFLVGRDGRVLRRFRSKTVPEDPKVIEGIESALAQ